MYLPVSSVCYERVPWYPTVLTFILSALWHGVDPGYYFTFLTGILVTLAARTVSFLRLWGVLLSNQMPVCVLSFRSQQVGDHGGSDVLRNQQKASR